MFFALVHFRALHPIVATHPTCVFLSLGYDTHIVGHALDVLFFGDYKKSLTHLDF
jgi:alpha-ketoglutarate-dependent taurine dioxygenase